MASPLRRRIPLGALVGVGVALVIACDNSDHEEDDTQFRADVIYCEEAVARLEKCCGSTFVAQNVECRHYYEKDTGCGSTTIDKVDPAWTVGEATCIHDTTCEQIQKANICQRALQAGRARITSYRSDDTLNSPTTSSTTSGSAATGPICP